MKPKYLVYRTDQWYDGCDAEETLGWAERYFNDHLADIKKGKHGKPNEYLIFAKIEKCLSFKEIQSSRTYLGDIIPEGFTQKGPFIVPKNHSSRGKVRNE